MTAGEAFEELVHKQGGSRRKSIQECFSAQCCISLDVVHTLTWDVSSATLSLKLGQEEATERC